MKRILVYGMTDNRGGMEAYVMNYFRKIDRSKYMFDFVTDAPTIAYEEEIHKLGGKIYFVPSRRENLFKHMREIRSVIKENGYSIVYYNLLSASAVFSVLAAYAMKNVKIIVHSHNNSVDKMRNHLLLRPLLNWIVDVRFACTREAAEFMFGNKNVKKTVLIKNAIDTEKFIFNSEVRDLVRDKLNIKQNFVIGSIGRLCYQKNSVFLIEIFKAILEKNKDAILLLVGEGEDRPEVEKKVKELKIEESVLMLGMRSDIEDLLQAMDVFLFPSRFEGLGIVLVEAQAAGLACVTSKDVVPEVVKVTSILDFVSLDKTPFEWAEEVTKYREYDRNNTINEIKNSGYDINSQVAYLESIFEEL